MLEIVVRTPGDLIRYPMAVYEDAQWAHLECATEKENMIKKGAAVLMKYNAFVECSKFYGEEI